MTKEMKKRLLFLEDLYDFYLNKYKRSTHFSAEKSGHQIFVQVPAQFEVVDDEYKDDSLLFCKVKLMHSGENRNKSNVTDDALKKAAKGLAYKPILANFMEYTDEETGEVLKDFTAHDMEFNEDGTINYIEKQIGCFTSDEPFFEVEEETGHNFLYGYCAIPREYTDATTIIERKGGTKISVELGINSMEFDAKSKVLNLTDVVIMGATCLGKDPDTLKDIGEGMLNARLDIADFSAENNSVLKNYQSQMIEFQARLEKLESACFNTTLSEEGGKTLKLEELLAKYEVALEDLTFEVEGLSDEELEAKFAEVFEGEPEEGEPNDVDEENPSDDTAEEPKEEGETEEPAEPKESEEEPKTEEPEETTEFTVNKEELFNQLFEISFNEIHYALNSLCSVYRTESEWCYVSQVYDNYFIMEDWDNDKYYKQSYTKDGDNIALSGERTELFAMFLTESEKISIEEMRSNYSSIVDELATYKSAEELADKMEVFADEDYAEYLETAEFKEIMAEEFVKQFTKEELVEKANAALGKLVKANKTFSAAPKKRTGRVAVYAEKQTEETYKPYGDLFDE